MNTLICGCCKEEKSIEHFPYVTCHDCKKQQAKDTYYRHQEKFKEAARLRHKPKKQNKAPPGMRYWSKAKKAAYLGQG